MRGQHKNKVPVQDSGQVWSKTEEVVPTYYGVWVIEKTPRNYHDGGGWLSDRNSIVFNTPSRAVAEAQLFMSSYVYSPTHYTLEVREM